MFRVLNPSWVSKKKKKKRGREKKKKKKKKKKKRKEKKREKKKREEKEKKKRKEKTLSIFYLCFCVGKMFSSAKVEVVPTTKSEPDADLSKDSKESVTPPPSDESDPIVDESRVDPVFIKAPALGIMNRTPAIRITQPRTAQMIGIFPLTRIELGDVWMSNDDIAKMEIVEIEGDWLSALSLFPFYVDYPDFYLRAIMGVLRAQMFMDKTPLLWSRWRIACKTTNPQLYAFVACSQCKKLRALSMRILYTLGNSKRTDVRCSELGLSCNEDYVGVIEHFILIQPVIMEPKQPSAPESKTLNDSLLQLAVYTPSPEKKAKTDRQTELPANDYVTWSQVAPPVTNMYAFSAVSQQQFFDPYDASQSAPEHFISGNPVIKFVARDPTPTEVADFKSWEATREWKETLRDIGKWSDARKEAQYSGEERYCPCLPLEHIAANIFHVASNCMNVVAHAELAARMFSDRASAWWLAHHKRASKLLVTFDQLLEWIKRELVPHSSTSDAVNSWCNLVYSGDVKKYINDLERLINHFPLRRESILIMATRPLGKEIQERVQLMDVQHGPCGITIAQLKKAIRSFLTLSPYSKPVARERDYGGQTAFAPRTFRPRPVSTSQPQYHIHKDNIPTLSREPKPKTVLNAVNLTTSQEKEKKQSAQTAKQIEQSAIPSILKKMRIGVGPTPCFVCGSDKHAWLDCPKKKKGRCACCGSEAHLTRFCAQRYVPQVQMAFHSCNANDDFQYIPDNDPRSSITVEEIIDDEQNAVNEEVSVESENEKDDEAQLVEEFEQMALSFHMQPMKMFCQIQDDSDAEQSADEFLTPRTNVCESSVCDKTKMQTYDNECTSSNELNAREVVNTQQAQNQVQQTQLAAGHEVSEQLKQEIRGSASRLRAAFKRKRNWSYQPGRDPGVRRPPFSRGYSFNAPTTPQWNDLVKVLHDDSNPHLFPVQCPAQVGQLLYTFKIGGYNVVTLLDFGASHSFISKEWAADKDLDLTPVRPPRPVGMFSGDKNYIRHVAIDIPVFFGEHKRSWSFYVIDSAPYSAVIGADAMMSWPIFFSPMDFRIFIVPKLYHAEHLAGELGGIYEYWEDRDNLARARWLSRRRQYDDPPTALDRTPTTSEDENYRARNPIVPLCHVNMEPEANLAYPWNEYDPNSMWLFAVDGLTRDIECTDDNLLCLHTVTASGDEEKEKLEEFMNSISPELRELVHSFPQLFSPPDCDPPQRPVKHYIYVASDTVPVARRAYRLGDIKRDAMFEQMRELIDKGWVVPSASPWAAPILFVPKDNGTKLRMCVDFRDLNALTKKDAFPLPRIDLLLHKAAKAKIFSNLDLASGFHQIEVDVKHRELTVFILPEPVDGCSLWEWKVMPFGLVNAPLTFQRAMSYALRGCENFTCVYIDDVLIFSETMEEHLAHLKTVFEKLQNESYHVRLAKCQFIQNEVKFLGHILSNHGIDPLATRREDLDRFQPPFDTPKMVRSFLGLVMWYKAFVPHISTIAAPLFPMTSSKRKIEWTCEATQAVEALKQSVLSAPTLVRFERSLPTRVTTDASNVGVGAVLEQLADGQWRPVAFWSRKLKDAETRYSATDIEWLAVVDAVTLVWRHFLEDIPFIVRSDHKALERKLHKSAHDPPISARQARWIERLMPFALTYEYVSGEDNQVADALSRYPHTMCLNTVTVMHSMLAGILPRIKIAAETDETYQSYLRKCRDNANTRFRIEDDVLIFGESNVYVPDDERLRTLLLSEAHDTIFGGHFGIERTLEKLKRHWFWPRMTKDVDDYVKSCSICQLNRHSTQRATGLLHPIKSDRPWQIVTMDFVGKFAPGRITGNTMCLVMVDKFSKYVLLESVPESVNAEQTADIFVRRVVSQFGVPESVISDRGPQFTADIWQRALNLLGSRASLATAHHPETDGQSERAIQTLLKLVRSYASENENEWEEMLPMFQFSMNDAYCEATGNTPFRVLFGCDPISPARLLTRQAPSFPTPDSNDETPVQWEQRTAEQVNRVWEFIRQNQQKVAQRMKARFDRNRSSLDLQPGDLVLLSSKSHRLPAEHRKHQQRFAGPYVIHARINDNAYKLSGLPPGVPTTQNVKFLRLFRPSPQRFQIRPTPDISPDVHSGTPEYEVEEILQDRGTRRRFRYLVKWANSLGRQWLPLHCMTHCGNLLKEYYEKNMRELPALVGAFIEQSALENTRDLPDEDENSDPGSESSEDEVVAIERSNGDD